MRRVVITGIGIISSIGNNVKEVTQSLKNGTSGIVFAPEYAERGFRSQIHGMPQIDPTEHIDKRQMRFMGNGAAYNYMAMEQAITDSGLDAGDVSNDRTGLIMGSGGPSTLNLFAAHNAVTEKGSPKKMGPFMVTRCMSSTNSACLATPFKIRGVNYSITSACSTSAHCIGNGVEQIQFNKQDIVFAGVEGRSWIGLCPACLTRWARCLPNITTRPNARPERLMRTAMVSLLLAVAGLLCWKNWNTRLARGAKIYAEVTGYGATSDGFDMVAPSGEGGERSMRLAMQTIGSRKVNYINAHGTSTPAGDVTEVKAIRTIFGADVPKISSTKSLTGHSLGQRVCKKQYIPLSCYAMISSLPARMWMS